MKTQKRIAMAGILAAFAITLVILTACPPEPHTHDWGNWVVTTPATATTPGEETRTCNTCGEKVTRPIPPTGSGHTHQYAATWSTDATQHWHECSCGDKKDVAAHTGDPCTVCGYAGTTHTHAYATTWSKDAAQHWHECSCGDKTDAAAHTASDWIIDTPATTTTAGSQHKECTVCGYVTETQPIAKLELETKTFPITFKNGALIFTVEYKAYPTDAEPAYLTYLQTRLGVVVNGEGTNAEATDHLMGKGSNFTITVEYANTVYEGIKWNATSRTFTIHNDWITTATGTDLSGAMIRNAFNAVE